MEIPQELKGKYVRFRENSDSKLIQKDDKWIFETKSNLYGFDAYLGWSIEPIYTETKYESLEIRGLLKTLEFSAIFIREAIDRTTITPLKAYFRQDFKIVIPDLKSFENIYVSKTEDGIFIHELPSCVFRLSLSSNDRFSELISKIGEPQKLTVKELQKLLKEKSTLGLFNEDFTRKTLLYRKLSSREAKLEG